MKHNIQQPSHCISQLFITTQLAAHVMYISTKPFSTPNACTVRAFIKLSVTICCAFVRFLDGA